MTSQWLLRPAPAQDKAAQIDTGHAHPARIHDYWLGGKNNFAADREAALQAVAVNPAIAADIVASRAFLGRALRQVAGDHGISQFLDIGPGFPSAGNTHEVVQSVTPSARIVYVDNDPIVLSHARALLTSGPDGCCDHLDADLRDTTAILKAAARTFDPSQPAAVILSLILHLIPDADEPAAIVRALMDALPGGSCLIIAHPASDIRLAETAEMTRRLNQRMSGHRATPRRQGAVTRLFAGLDLLSPGVVQPPQWRPDPGAGSAETAVWCGVAVKPRSG